MIDIGTSTMDANEDKVKAGKLIRGKVHVRITIRNA